MMILALAVALTGFLLGRRCRAVALVPATAVTWLAAGVFATVRGADFTSTMVTLAAAAVALQVAYVGGALTRYSKIKPRLARLSEALHSNRV